MAKQISPVGEVINREVKRAKEYCYIYLPLTWEGQEVRIEVIRHHKGPYERFVPNKILKPIGPYKRD